MKKIIYIIFMLAITLTLFSCKESLNSSSSQESGGSESSEESSEISSQKGESSTTKPESSSSSSESSSTGSTSSETSSTNTDGSTSSSSTHSKNQDYLKKNGPLTDEAFPSYGSPKLLVIPVNFDNTRATSTLLNDIEIAFNGTEEETGWESVKTFYEKSSYGKLTLSATVMNKWYTPTKTKTYYENYQTNNETGSDLLLSEVIAHYDKDINYSDYDYDNDGFIDSVWLVYNCAVDYENDSLWWAFQTWSPDEKSYDGKQLCYYGFAGTDFMYEESNVYNSEDIDVDAHTFIHETGHLMGLDDYYDYDPNNGADGGLYSADMMDYNIGDHGVISKMLLGWVSPTVVTSTTTINLKSFTLTGEAILVSKKYKNTIYDEYFLIEFYTTEGLNAHDQPIVGDNILGVRVTHVDAAINYKNGVIEDNGGAYSTGFKYDNSDTTYKFVNMLRADHISDKSNSEYLQDGKCLFTPTSKTLSQVFPNYKTHDKAALFFEMTVNSMNTTNVSITITFK